MKAKIDSVAHYAFHHAEGEPVNPGAILAPFIISQDVDHRELTSLLAENRGAIAEGLLEADDGQLVAYVLGWNTIDCDPAPRVALLEDASEMAWTSQGQWNAHTASQAIAESKGERRWRDDVAFESNGAPVVGCSCRGTVRQRRTAARRCPSALLRAVDQLGHPRRGKRPQRLPNGAGVGAGPDRSMRKAGSVVFVRQLGSARANRPSESTDALSSDVNRHREGQSIEAGPEVLWISESPQ